MGDFQGEIHSGDIRRQLTAMRDALAEAIAENLSSMKAKSGLCRKCGGDASAGSGIAAMTLRLRQVIADIEALPPEEEVTRLDELSRKRSKRRAGTPNSAQPQNPTG
jgi:hypothetical protein